MDLKNQRVAVTFALYAKHHPTPARETQRLEMVVFSNWSLSRRFITLSFLRFDR